MTNAPPTPRPLEKTAGVALIVALGGALRFFRLGQDALWSDEVASLRTARFAFWSIPEAALRHNAFEPPLYFWLLHLITLTLGDGEASLRLLSAAAGVLTIPLIWLLAWELSQSRAIGFLSAAFLAINPLHLWYSQEARPYALLVCLCTASLWALARALRTRSRASWVVFVVSSALAMLTHVAGGIVLVIAAGWVLLRRDRIAAGSFVLASVGSLILVAPGYIGLVLSVISATGSGSPERALTGLEVPYTIFTYLGGYSFGPSVREIQDTGWVAAARSHLFELGFAAAVLLAALTQSVTAAAGRTARQILLILFLLFVLPATVTWLGSAATGKAYNVRYAVLGVVGFVGLLSVALQPLTRPIRMITATLVCVVSLWADWQWFFDSSYGKEDARTAVAWLAARVPPGGLVAVAPGYVTGTLSHYAGRSGAPLCFLGVNSEKDLPTDPVPAALLLTRLHHAPRWRELTTRFESLSNDSLVRGAVTGYRLLARGGNHPSISQFGGSAHTDQGCSHSDRE